jgi:hypothetical protein
MELGAGAKDRYKKIIFWKDWLNELLVKVFLESHQDPPVEIILDVDTTDLALHSKQEGRFFHGYHRGDSGFCRNQLMSWCKNNGVDFVFGLARNQRLGKIIGAQIQQATQQWNQTAKPARVFGEFQYKTKKEGEQEGLGIASEVNPWAETKS